MALARSGAHPLLVCIPHRSAVFCNSRDISESEHILPSMYYGALNSSKPSVAHIFNLMNSYYVSTDSKIVETLNSGFSIMTKILLTPMVIVQYQNECESPRQGQYVGEFDGCL